MDLAITREPNDGLLITLLGIQSVTVSYDDIPDSLANDYQIRPTSADVTLKPPIDVTKEEDWTQVASAAAQWVASRFEVDVLSVTAYLGA